MTRSRVVVGLAVSALICIAFGLYLGLHPVTRGFEPINISAPSYATRCGSVLSPQTPPSSFGWTSFGPARHVPREFTVQSCDAARHRTAVWTLVLLPAGVLALL